MSDNQITHYIFNVKYIYADIYWCFERVMSLGVRNMYQVTKEVTLIRDEVTRGLRAEAEE